MRLGKIVLFCTFGLNLTPSSFANDAPTAVHGEEVYTPPSQKEVPNPHKETKDEHALPVPHGEKEGVALPNTHEEPKHEEGVEHPKDASQDHASPAKKIDAADHPPEGTKQNGLLWFGAVFVILIVLIFLFT